MTSGITVFMAFTTIFLVVKLFPMMTLLLGLPGTFWLFGAVCVLTAIFTVFFLPETSGKTMAQIQAMFQKGQGENDT